jgi:hypothetical protein
MHYTPRTIALLTELLHPPLQLDQGQLQKIHNELFEDGSPPYQNFQVTPLGIVFSNPSTQPGAISQVAFLADRMQFREELSSLTVDEFAARVTAIGELVAERRGIQLYTAQQVTLRTLVNLRNYKDSRVFLQQGVLDLDQQVDAFGRDPRMWGLRMVFPPAQDQPNAFSLRIESYTADPRSLFIENQGTFGPAPVAGGLGRVGECIGETYSFTVQRALDFIGRFDARPTE